MAIAFTFRAGIHNTTGATSYTALPAFTPAANSLMVALFIVSGKTDAPVSIQTTSATNRYTFAEYSHWSTSNNAGIWIASSGATPPNDSITLTTSATNATGCALAVIEVTGADMTGTVANAIVARESAASPGGTGTTGTLTFAAAGNSANRPLVYFEHAANEATTERANWTELDDGSYASPAVGFQVQCRADAFETTSTATWTTSAGWIALGVEIKAASTGDSSFAGMVPI